MKTQILSISTFLILLLSFYNVHANNNPIHLNSMLEIISYEMEEIAFESEMDIEDWMVNDELWSEKKSNVLIEKSEKKEKNEQTFSEDSEDMKNHELEVEKWMTNDELWRF